MASLLISMLTCPHCGGHAAGGDPGREVRAIGNRAPPFLIGAIALSAAVLAIAARRLSRSCTSCRIV